MSSDAQDDVIPAKGKGARRQRMPRYRAWVFTSYEDPTRAGYSCRGPDCPAFQDQAAAFGPYAECTCDPAKPWPAAEYTYIVYGKERCPSTQRIHYQGYLEYGKPITRASILRQCCVSVGVSFTLDYRKGTQKQAVDYCRKDGEVTEFGNAAASGGVSGHRSDLVAVKDGLLGGSTIADVSTSHFALYCQYRRSFEAFKDLHAVSRSWPTKVTVLWGDTGTGKTATAIAAGAKPISIDKSGFFHGQLSDIMLIDEFEPTMASRSLFLQLTDRYPMMVNIKGGSANWAPRELYLTSNHDPRAWYTEDGGEQDPAVRRRFTDNGSSIKHLTEPFSLKCK